jgi:hypothetical protein
MLVPRNTQGHYQASISEFNLKFSQSLSPLEIISGPGVERTCPTGGGPAARIAGCERADGRSVGRARCAGRERRRRIEDPAATYLPGLATPGPAVTARADSRQYLVGLAGRQRCERAESSRMPELGWVAGSPDRRRRGCERIPYSILDGENLKLCQERGPGETEATHEGVCPCGRREAPAAEAPEPLGTWHV